MTKLLFFFLFLFIAGPAYAQNLISQPDVVAINHQADNLIKTYQFNKAIVLMEEYLANNEEDDIKILHKLAICHTNLGNLFKAKKYYNQMLKNDSSHLHALNKLGSIYTTESNYKKAADCYQQLILQDSTNSYYYKKLANIKSKQGILSRAIQLFDTALIYNPDDIESIISLAEIYGELMDMDPSLKQHFNQSIKRGFELDSLNRKLLELSAENDFKLKKYKSTIASIHLVLQYHQDTTGLHAHLLGMANKQIKKWEKAEQWFHFLIDKEEDTELTHYYLAMVYDEQKKQDLAIKHFQMAINRGISNNIHSYYISLGKLYENNGKNGKAVKAYQKAYEHSQINILLYKLAINSEKYYKDKSIALRYYERYLDNVKQDNEYTEYARYKINKIREYLHAKNNL
jgi:tetratricopeptide (TPR) repeat protein